MHNVFKTWSYEDINAIFNALYSMNLDFKEWWYNRKVIEDSNFIKTFSLVYQIVYLNGKQWLLNQVMHNQKCSFSVHLTADLIVVFAVAQQTEVT